MREPLGTLPADTLCMTGTVSLTSIARQSTALLTTFKRDGSPVATAVHLAPHGERAVFRTWDKTWKWKRLRRNPSVTVAPCTIVGNPTGPAIAARARLLSGEEARQAARLLGSKYPILHTWLFPFLHRLMGAKTVHFELVQEGDSPAAAGAVGVPAARA